MAGRQSRDRDDVRIDQRLALHFQYPVLFTRGLFRAHNELLVALLAGDQPTPARVFVAIDDGVLAAQPELRQQLNGYFAAHASRLELVREPLAVVGGEQAKNDARVVEQVHERLFGARLDRHSYALVIGGGAVLDAVGYAAALFHRGMRVVRAPTTVLAQNDAGVGVKNGVNAFGVKNGLGTFAPPFAVVNDLEFLRSLSARDRIAGMAEAVKVSLIRERGFFEWIEQRAAALRAGEEGATAFLVQRCAALHLEHIRAGGDPFETGSARPLDFGHWAAHKLEVMTQHALRHGEAVAIGMGIDVRYARKVGLLARELAERVEHVIAALGLPLHHPALLSREDDGSLSVLRGLDDFREHLGGSLCVTVPRALGEAVELREIDRALMSEAILSAGAAR